MPEQSCTMALESFVLLAGSAKGAAAMKLIQQALEANGVYVFGELLDHTNIKALEKTDPGDSYFRLLKVFAYGTYSDYLQNAASLPPLTAPSLKKLRLLTIASMATKAKLLSYASLQAELGLASVRELEDLIIDGTNNSVLRGKLDQKSSHFEVDYAMGRDIQQSDMTHIAHTLQQWHEGCDEMLSCLKNQIMRANDAKASHIEHKQQMEQKISEIRGQLKAQQQLDDCDHPDSRMDTDRKKGPPCKIKGQRPAGKSTFWSK